MFFSASVYNKILLHLDLYLESSVATVQLLCLSAECLCWLVMSKVSTPAATAELSENPESVCLPQSYPSVREPATKTNHVFWTPSVTQRSMSDNSGSRPDRTTAVAFLLFCLCSAWWSQGFSNSFHKSQPWAHWWGFVANAEKLLCHEHRKGGFTCEPPYRSRANCGRKSTCILEFEMTEKLLNFYHVSGLIKDMNKHQLALAGNYETGATWTHLHPRILGRHCYRS